VPQHRVRVVRADQHQVEAADALRDRPQLDEPGLRHGARVERRDLAHVVVGRAHEPGGVRGLGHVHAGAVHAVALEPGAVVTEVLADRTDQDRGTAEHGHAERDVRTDPTAPDHEVVDEEAQGDPVQLFRDELLGEPPREVHEVVGRDASGDGYGHEGFPCLVVVRWSDTEVINDSGRPCWRPTRGLRRHYRLVRVVRTEPAT
jgi:hypothetical protein